MSWMADIAFSTKNSFADRVRQSVARFLLGGIGLALVTLLSSRFELRSGVASLFYLTVVAVVSLTGDFVSSAGIAITAILCLRYFITLPPSTPEIGRPLETIFRRDAFIAWAVTQLFAWLGWLLFFYPTGVAVHMGRQLFGL